MKIRIERIYFKELLIDNLISLSTKPFEIAQCEEMLEKTVHSSSVKRKLSQYILFYKESLWFIKDNGR